MNILQINTSAKRHGSESTRLAKHIVAQLRSRHPEASLTIRDLAAQPMLALDEAALGALFTPASDRSLEQAARVAVDDAVIAELQAADVLVLGVPMYNLGIPAQLKHWIDAVTRARVTFQYTASGPEGLLKGKKVFLALTRGGQYRDSAIDTQVPYLKTILAFLGMTDVHLLYAEGLAMGPEAVAASFARAEEELAAELAEMA